MRKSLVTAFRYEILHDERRACAHWQTGWAPKLWSCSAPSDPACDTTRGRAEHARFPHPRRRQRHMDTKMRASSIWPAQASGRGLRSRKKTRAVEEEAARHESCHRAPRAARQGERIPLAVAIQAMAASQSAAAAASAATTTTATATARARGVASLAAEDGARGRRARTEASARVACRRRFIASAARSYEDPARVGAPRAAASLQSSLSTISNSNPSTSFGPRACTARDGKYASA